MAAIGMLLLWASYTLILYGVCLMRGYQITMLDLVVPGRWKGGWPPSLISDATSGASGSGSGGSSGSGSSGGTGSGGSGGGSTKLPLPTGPFSGGSGSGGGGGVLEA